MTISIANAHETGSLRICQLKRFWTLQQAVLEGRCEARSDEYIVNRILCDALGVGLHQMLQQACRPDCSFEMLEAWVVETAGVPDSLKVERFNTDLSNAPAPASMCRRMADIESMGPVFSDDELEFWNANGYILLKHAVSIKECQRAEAAIWEHIHADPDDPSTWVSASTNGIMVELIQHDAIDENRHSNRIHKAFSQLWGTTDLWVSKDRCGFNAPECCGVPFPGPDLHWDIEFHHAHTFCTQGILYLTDTPDEQGATTLVPGFQHKLVDWLKSLPGDFDPQQHRELDLHALGSKPVGGNAGDMLIWHHALPHGSRPNRLDKPRIVQYINMYPLRNYQHWMGI
ncbi:phytanoyl-CoA dioxygenase family protein [Pseudomonadota bacterium]